MTTAPSNSAPALATRLAFIASFLGVGMIAPWAPAQATLDLRPPASAPAPGSGLGAPALAQAMRLEAQRIARESPDDAGAARAAMRSLAADLLESGEAMGETGSIRVVLARTIVRGLDELDASIGALAGDDADARAVALRLLASDCDGARAALKNATADPWRAVRDSLSVLSRAANATPTGWPEASDADKPEGDVPGVESIRGTLSKIPGVSADARAAAEPALALIAEVDDHSPSWPAARHLRRAIARSAEVLANRPAWLPDAPASAAGGALLFAIPRLASATDRDAALLLVDRLAAWSELVRAGARLGADAAAGKARSSLAEIVPTATSGATLEHLRRARSLLEPVTPVLIDEKGLARQYRPAWRALVQSLRAGEGPLLVVLPDAIRTPDSIADPALLTPLGAQRRALEDLRLLERFARLSAAPPGKGAAEPQVTAPYARLADRVLKIGQELARPDRAPEATLALRTLLESLDRFLTMPGEPSLQSALALGAGDPDRAAWDALTGGRTGALRSEIIARRDAWLETLRKGGTPAPEDIARLDALRELLGTLDALAPAVPAKDRAPTPALAAMQGWGAWELGVEARLAIAEGIAKEAAEATRLTLEGDAPASASALKRLRERHAPALLMGRLAHEHHAHAGDRGAGTILGEIGFGGPVRGESWLGEQAGTIAEVCRYAEELVALQRAIDTGNPPPKGPKPEELRRWIDDRARTVIEAMGTRTAQP